MKQCLERSWGAPQGGLGDGKQSRLREETGWGGVRGWTPVNSPSSNPWVDHADRCRGGSSQMPEAAGGPSSLLSLPLPWADPRKPHPRLGAEGRLWAAEGGWALEAH